jgi:hypothetical protein
LTLLLFFTPVFIAMVGPACARAQGWTQEAKLVPADGQEGDLFGESVAIHGGRLVVGSRKQVDSPDPGAVYIFDRSGSDWSQLAKVVASDAAAGDLFGEAVAIHGNRVLVGARKGNPFGDRGPGAAYIFEPGAKKSRWLEVAKLRASDEDSLDWFGSSVAISGDWAVVGAWRANSDTGAAYVFHYQESAWTEVAKWIASSGSSGDRFGYDVSLAGDFAIVGASGDTERGPGAGAAYIFHGADGAWTEIAKLTPAVVPPDQNQGLQPVSFGSSVSISGERAIVGAFGDDQYGEDAGAAYIFQRSQAGWQQVAKLSPGDAQAGDLFGWSVDISGSRAVVGSRRDDNDLGAAYVFELLGDDWIEVAKLTAEDRGMDQFGISVALDRGRAVIGAWRDDENGAVSGSAYVLAVPEPEGIVLVAIGLAVLSSVVCGPWSVVRGLWSVVRGLLRIGANSADAETPNYLSTDHTPRTTDLFSYARLATRYPFTATDHRPRTTDHGPYQRDISTRT